MQFQILYEDNHLIAVNKPPGLLVHGDETEDVTLADQVKDYIKVRYKKPGEVYLGVIHRLDRPVSGVVVLARTSKALARMNKIFKDRQVQKVYWAITEVQPDPLSGTLTHYVGKDKSKNIAHAFDALSNRAEKANAKLSELSYKLISKIGDNHLLEVKPITGRPHQIRVQLSKMGWAIRGDVKYGFPSANKDKSIYLHCRSISFEHPVKNEVITIEADPPETEFWRLFYEMV